METGIQGKSSCFRLQNVIKDQASLSSFSTIHSVRKNRGCTSQVESAAALSRKEGKDKEQRTEGVSILSTYLWKPYSETFFYSLNGQSWVIWSVLSTDYPHFHSRKVRIFSCYKHCYPV